MFFLFLRMELKFIKGLSDKRISDLNAMGIMTAEDLLRHFPRTYLDMRHPVKLCHTVNNDFALTIGTIVSIPQYTPSRGKYNFFRITCVQDDEPFTVIWFNQPYIRSKLKEGETYLFYGRTKNRFGIVSMSNPSFEVYDENIRMKGIVPVYSVKGCLTQKVMRSVIADALNKVSFTSMIAENACKTYGLTDLNAAYRTVHCPESFDLLQVASERIAAEEYYIMISAFRFIKGNQSEARAQKYTVTASELKEFTLRFGFEFTMGQKQAVNEIYSDLKRPVTMNRLLQGDVGSGKTAVAITAIYMAVRSHMQVAFIAPTEVLAKQNFALVQKYLSEYKTCFLSGSVTAKEKIAIKEKIYSGEIQIVIGTHAVLSKDVKFANLGLCVCDEQQRFGVAQRNSLVEKGKRPDVLIMSATPIPRTLSLIFYGDLDISTIHDKPKARAEIKTYIVPQSKYRDMLTFITNEFRKGRQAYFVCPKIEGDDEGSLLSVQELYEELKKALPDYKFGLLHGKLKDAQKTEIMLDFSSGKLDAVVSTTVIEVGIDVANATVMCIFGADRFGLSQLHQLRGRVGRSDLLSYCFLIADTENEVSLDRLKAIKNNSDGFKISEIDYSERGGGDFLGTRQSGKLMTELGSLRYTTAAIFLAKKLSDQAFENGDNIILLKNVALKKYERLKDVALN